MARWTGGVMIVMGAAALLALLSGCGRDEVALAEADGPESERPADDDDLFSFDPDRVDDGPRGNNGGNNPTDPEPGNNGVEPTPDCEPGTTRCDGDIAVVCATGGVERTTFCQEQGAFCGESRRGAGCIPWVCDPGAQECVNERASGVCSPRGDEYAVVERCERGCDQSTGQCRLPPESRCDDPDAFPEVGPGVTTVDLCAGENTNYNVRGDGCGADGEQFEGRDATFRLRIEQPSRVQIDLRDADDEAAIDTVLYVQSECGQPESQLACHDDLECSESDVEVGCEGGSQVRHSRLTLRLDAGEYYVVADQYSYGRRGTNFTCGTVTVSVEVTPLDG